MDDQGPELQQKNLSYKMKSEQARRHSRMLSLTGLFSPI